MWGRSGEVTSTWVSLGVGRRGLDLNDESGRVSSLIPIVSPMGHATKYVFLTAQNAHE